MPVLGTRIGKKNNEVEVYEVTVILNYKEGKKGITFRHKNDRKRNKSEQDRIKICGFCRVYEQQCVKI